MIMIIIMHIRGIPDVVTYYGIHDYYYHHYYVMPTPMPMHIMVYIITIIVITILLFGTMNIIFIIIGIVRCSLLGAPSV